MLSKDTKEKYIKLIKRAGSDSPAAESLIAFIESYQGEDTEQLGDLVGKIVILFLAYDDLKIRAEGFDKLLAIKGDFEKQMDVIKEEYRDLKNGRMPLNLPLADNVDFNDVEES